MTGSIRLGVWKRLFISGHGHGTGSLGQWSYPQAAGVEGDFGQCSEIEGLNFGWCCGRAVKATVVRGLRNGYLRRGRTVTAQAFITPEVPHAAGMEPCGSLDSAAAPALEEIPQVKTKAL